MSTLKKLVIWLVVIMITAFSISSFFFNRYGIGAQNEGFLTWFSSLEHLESKILSSENIDFSSIDQVHIITNSEDIEIDQSLEGTLGTVTLMGSVPDDILQLDIEKTDHSIFIKIIPVEGLVVYNQASLNIVLPSQVFELLTIETKSGDTTVNMKEVNHINFKSLSGDLDSKLLYVENGVLDSQSGDLSLSNLKGNLNITTLSGDVYTYYETFKNSLSVDSQSGDIRLSFDETVDFDISFNSESGDYNFSLPVLFMDTPSDNLVHAIAGSGENKITIKTTSGDLKIY